MFGTTSGAVLSDDLVYRYALWRRWEGNGILGFVMLNPSTADAYKDDATIRRCKGFARASGLGGFVVGNVYAYRATRPANLWKARKQGLDIVGTENRWWLGEIARSVNWLVCAWGENGRYSPDAADTLALLRRIHPRPLRHLGLTSTGQPRHPLRLPRATVPCEWPLIGTRDAGGFR